MVIYRKSHKKVVIFHKKVVKHSQKSRSLSSGDVVNQRVTRGEKGTKKYKKHLQGKKGAYRRCFLYFLVCARRQKSDEKQKGKRAMRSLVEPHGD